MDDNHLIRATAIRDIPDLYRVRASTRQNAIPERQLLEWGITPCAIADDLASGRLAGFVCEQADAVVGFCSGDTLTGEVLVLAVLPEHESRGVGTALLDKVVDALTARGCRRIWLACSPDPESRSHGFYRHHGWIDSGERMGNGDEILLLAKATDA